MTARLTGKGAATTAYDFAVEMNRRTAVRHTKDRHSIIVDGIQKDKACTRITYVVQSGTL